MKEVKKKSNRRGYKKEKSTFKLKEKEKGITLIALVITIIVLLILAGVTIAMITGEDGILNKATKAADETQKENIIESAQRDILGLLADNLGKDITKGQLKGVLEKYFDDVPAEEDIPDDMSKLKLNAKKELGGYEIEIGEIYSGNTPPLITSTQIKDNLEGNIDREKNTTVYDEFNNPVTIPAGFHIVTNEEDSTVEYDYSDSGMPTVQDGIVVQDGDGNQFVWIPLETDKEKIKDKPNDNHENDTPIKLGRYKFDAIYNSEPTGNGIATLVQPADQYADESNDEYKIYFNNDKENNGSYYYYELTEGKGNTVAKELDKFLESATQNRGYYLARYEASKGTSNKVESKGNVNPWNEITQPNAATAAQKMYTSDKFTSDLVNSYAWDTAIVFIQKYSENKTYSKQNSKNTTETLTTGERNGTTDKVCNIYDMASNCVEWTTETCTGSYPPCVARGGIWRQQR